MLGVYYCKNKTCQKIHIRNNDRSSLNEFICPRCSGKLAFVSDYFKWTLYSNEERSRVLEEGLLYHENEYLKLLAETCVSDYDKWKSLSVVYHDELWNILEKKEPSKYNRINYV